MTIGDFLKWLIETRGDNIYWIIVLLIFLLSLKVGSSLFK